MKRYTILILTVVLFFYTQTESWAGGGNADINRQTSFNNFTDSLATLGRSPQQKTAIQNKRRLARSQPRLKKVRAESIESPTSR